MAGRQRPKTGEARKTRQPFAIDKLPTAWRDRIKALRAKWVPWEEIEEETRNFDWKSLEESETEIVFAYFADKRIPHSTLHRWYDVQVEQKEEGIARERGASRAIAEAFAKAGYENLEETVKNALTDVVLAHVKDSDDSQKLAGALQELALVLTRFKRTEIAKERVDLDKKKLDEIIHRADKSTNEAAAKIGKGGKLTIDDINRLRERTFGLPPVQRIAAAGPPA